MEYAFIGIIVILLGVSALNKLSDMEKQIKNQRLLLDRISAQLNIPEHPINDKLRKLLTEGKDVKAIKEAREALGLSLVEGKQYVDALKNK